MGGGPRRQELPQGLNFGGLNSYKQPWMPY